MALGVAEATAPYAKAEIVIAPRVSEPLAPVALSGDPTTVVIASPAALSPARDAIRGPAGAKRLLLVPGTPKQKQPVKNADGAMAARVDRAMPALSGDVAGHARITVGKGAEPVSPAPQPIRSGLAVPGSPVKIELGHRLPPGAGLSASAMAGHQLAASKMAPADKHRLIYGTSARNADKVYFPRSFPQSATVVEDRAEAQLASSTPRRRQSPGEGGMAVEGTGKGIESARLSLAGDRAGATGEVREPSMQGGYYHYETASAKSTGENDVAKLAGGDSAGNMATPDIGAGKASRAADALSGTGPTDLSMGLGGAS